MKIWVGKELEGTLKGDNTLFIGNRDVTFSEISKILEERRSILQIYFGAGGCTEPNYQVIKKCLERYLSELEITLEVVPENIQDIPDDILRTIHLIVTINNDYFSQFKRLKSNRVQIKLQSLGRLNNKILMVGPLHNFIKTDVKELEGNKYKDDVVLK